MTSDAIGKLLLIVFFLLCSAYFSATETAFSSLSRTRVQMMADHGSRGAKLALKLSERYDDLLSTILVGNNIVNIAIASIGTILFVRRFGEDLGSSLSTVVVTVVVLFCGEVTPKSMAKEAPEKVAIAAQLDATGISMTLKNKRGKVTNRIKRCKTIQVNFNIAKNVTAVSGNKTVYVRITTPAGTVLSGGGTFAYENRSLPYSMRKVIEYTGNETPVTTYWTVNEFLGEGTYNVSIFADGNMIGSRNFTIK